MIGPGINSACIVGGALVGILVGRKLGKDFRAKLMLVFGCISTGMGVYMIGKAQALPPIVCSLLIGSLCGELFRLERLVNYLAHKAAALFDRKKNNADPAAHKALQEQFSVFTVIFCASGLGFFGSMQEGLTGDGSLLFIKAMLDFPTAMFVAANIGASVIVLAAPQFLIQMATLLSAGLLVQWATPLMQGDFSSCGGFIMLATGLRMCGVANFPILSMLPALAFVMPVSAGWTLLMG